MCTYNKAMLDKIMHAHGDKCKDLAAAIGMAATNLSKIRNNRWEFNLKYIRLIARRYSLSPQQVYDIFIFPGECSEKLITSFSYNNERRISGYDKPMLEEIMHAHGDKCKDLAAAINIATSNLSRIRNGLWEFNLRHIRLIAKRYSLSPQQIYDIFIFPKM